MRRAYLEVRERHTMLWIVQLAEEEVPQTKLPCLHLELLDDWNDRLPALHRIGRQLSMSDLARGKSFVLVDR